MTPIELTAYPVQSFAKVENGNPKRDWMDDTFQKFAYGCLPLVIANQMGWDIICQTSFKATWNGGNSATDIEVVFEDVDNKFNHQVMTHFGYGVITFNPGFLFTTSANHNLWIKGVPNYIKDGIQPLEGIVETDWLPFTFTMNWKFTRANEWIEFKAGEPMCRILPYPRNYIEEITPKYKMLNENEPLKEAYLGWTKERDQHNQNLIDGTAETRTEKNYLQGRSKDGTKVGFHQSKINLQKFTR
jgi:hypothetical protein